jgi:Xaa-Pro aminopeptidase
MDIAFNLSKRKNALRKLMRNDKLEALLITSPQRMYYFSGYFNTDAYLLLTKRKSYLISDPRYSLELNKIKAKADILISRSPLKDVVNKLKEQKVKSLAIEEDSTSYQLYSQMKDSLKGLRITKAAKHIKSLMVIKDSQEIRIISKACRIANNIFGHLKRKRLAGLSERQVAAYINFYISKLGFQPADYEPIVASGVRSAMPHAEAGNHKIKKESNCLIDLGIKVYGYNSDLTRVLALSKMKAEYKKVYDIVKYAQKQAINAIKPGVEAKAVDKAARDVINDYGYGKYFTHATGHGIGLMVHEAPSISPVSTEILRPQMVFTIEPGIYLPHKFGIRIEDVVAVTKKGCKILSHDISGTV